MLSSFCHELTESMDNLVHAYNSALELLAYNLSKIDLQNFRIIDLEFLNSNRVRMHKTT